MALNNLTTHMAKINGKKYFRSNAHLVSLGTVGEKKDPIGPAAYIDPQMHLDNKDIEVFFERENPPVFDVDFSKFSRDKIGGDGSVNVYGVDFISGMRFSYDRLKTADLTLVNYSIPEEKLKNLINKHYRIFDYLKDEGKDARIVSEIWVVEEATLSEQHNSDFAANIGASLPEKFGFALNIGRAIQQNSTIQFSTGTVFAYKLSKIKKYDKKKKKKATRVEDLEADYKGNG